MLRIAGWLCSMSVSFYAGMLYCGYHVIDLPDSSVEKIIKFVKTVQKLSEVF